MNFTRVGRIVEQIEYELAGKPEIRADLLAVFQHEPQLLFPWLGVIDEAEQHFGSLAAAVHWLATPNPHLDNRSPMMLVGLDLGLEIVREELSQQPYPEPASASRLG